MPSSFTPRLRLEMQAAGENLNTWGAPKLNNVIARLDFAVAGWTTIALAGDYALASSNGDDEARSAMLKFTGSGAYTVTIPAVGKRYDVWNALSGPLTITAGGAGAVLQPGEKVSVVCDGAAVHRVQPTDFGNARITSVADPTGGQDAATKKYVDDTAFTANAGVLPGQAGNAGRFLTTDGAVAGWGEVLPPQLGAAGKFLNTNGDAAAWILPTTGSLADYPSDQLVREVATLYLLRTNRR